MEPGSCWPTDSEEEEEFFFFKEIWAGGECKYIFLLFAILSEYFFMEVQTSLCIIIKLLDCECICLFERLVHCSVVLVILCIKSICTCFVCVIFLNPVA